MKQIIVFISLFLSVVCFGQTTDEQLANEYFEVGEYEKAASYYKRLFRKNDRSNYIYDNYLTSLIALEDYKGSETLIKKQIKTFPESYYFKVDLGALYKESGQEEKAKKLFDGLIKSAASSGRNNVVALSQSFIRKGMSDYSLKTFEKGAQELGVMEFWPQLIALYRNNKSHKDLVDLSLAVLKNEDNHLVRIIGNLDHVLEDEVASEYLQKETLSYIQKNPGNQVFDDLLYQIFLQQKKYSAAFRQIVSIDKRNNYEGEKIYQFSQNCLPIKQYRSAIKGYAYIMENYPDGIYFNRSRIGSLNASYLELSTSFNPSEMEAQKLVGQFDKYFDENTLDFVNAPVAKRLAELSIYYTRDIARGVDLLERIIKLPRLQATFIAQSKLLLGDAYLIQNNIWDAKIMYGQVDKQFKEDALGQMAKFKNAKLSYFTGDFEWAKSQLDVLKTATTQLISNNAIELALLIQDNTGLDTTEDAMIEYANAAFLLFQNDIQGCQEILNLLPFKYPDHQLQDEVYYLQAQLEQKKSNYTKALSLYKKVYEGYSQDILADNALFQAAEIQLFGLNDPKVAKSLYEKLLLEYNSSLFAVEARKKFYALQEGKTKDDLFFEGQIN